MGCRHLVGGLGVGLVGAVVAEEDALAGLTGLRGAQRFHLRPDPRPSQAGTALRQPHGRQTQRAPPRHGGCDDISKGMARCISCMFPGVQ